MAERTPEIMFCLVTGLSRGTSKTTVTDRNRLEEVGGASSGEFITSQSPLQKGTVAAFQVRELTPHMGHVQKGEEEEVLCG